MKTYEELRTEQGERYLKELKAKKYPNEKEQEILNSQNPLKEAIKWQDALAMLREFYSSTEESKGFFDFSPIDQY